MPAAGEKNKEERPEDNDSETAQKLVNWNNSKINEIALPLDFIIGEVILRQQVFHKKSSLFSKSLDLGLRTSRQ